jgi:hypothetical protein
VRLDRRGGRRGRHRGTGVRVRAIVAPGRGAVARSGRPGIARASIGARAVTLAPATPPPLAAPPRPPMPRVMGTPIGLRAGRFLLGGGRGDRIAAILRVQVRRTRSDVGRRFSLRLTSVLANPGGPGLAVVLIVSQCSMPFAMGGR